MSKYDPLRSHLECTKGNRWRGTFTEIENILGFALPHSARNHPAWWANENKAHQPQKLAWLTAGWRTANLNLTAETIEFVLDGSAEFSRNFGSTEVEKRSQKLQQSSRPDFWLDAVFTKLAAQRPLFHSEADFQHALAWSIRETNAHDPVRLEFKPISDERIYIDIWIRKQPPVAIELKYPTRAIDATVDSERFKLANQSAQDLTRYDFLKDVSRIERVAKTFPGSSGYAVLLTNDRSYWLPSQRGNTIDSAFRLFDGRRISGDLSWGENAGAGTMRTREQPIRIEGSYDLSWRPYSRIGGGKHAEFQYLLIAIGPTSQ